MLVIETAERPLSFLGATVVYRGINELQYRALRTSSAIAPRKPIGTAEAITLFASNLPMAHVLDRKRDHFVSFSLRLETAIWYGTSGGKSDGYLVTVRLPNGVTALKEAGSEPIAYAGDDGTQWVDPRHIAVGASLVEWSRFRSRAIVDQEILLAGGSVRAAQVARIPHNQCDHRFAPWAVSGERLQML